MRDIRDIPNLRSRNKRAEELFVDCYGDAEMVGALDVYLSEALDYPFEAEWRTYEGKARVTVLALADEGDEVSGLKFRAKVKSRTQLVPVHQVYSLEPKGRIATVLDDYRAWWPGESFEGEDE